MIRFVCPLAFFLVCLTVRVSAEDTAVDTNGMLPAGPVKCVTVEEAWFDKIDGKWVEGERFQTLTFTFDKDGHLLEKIEFAGKDVIKNRYLRTYDVNRNLIEKTQFNASGRRIAKVTYAYNDTGQVTCETDYGHYDTPFHIEQYRYDSNGNQVEKRLYDRIGLKYTIHHRYNAGGQLQDSTEVDAEEIRQLTTRFIYDSQNRLKKTFVFDKNDQLTAYWIYTYNDAGHQSEMNAYTAQRGLEMRKTYAYDDRGLLNDLTSYGVNGIFTSREQFQYRYDAQGNWIEKHERTARPTTSYTQPIRTIYRTIDYWTLNDN